MNRKTSVYTAEVRGVTAEVLFAACPVTVVGSGYRGTVAFVRFRAEDDKSAHSIAAQLTQGVYALHTGYGVNMRTVES